MIELMFSKASLAHCRSSCWEIGAVVVVVIIVVVVVVEVVVSIGAEVVAEIADEKSPLIRLAKKAMLKTGIMLSAILSSED